jgi:hypothetical protein
MSVQNCSRGSHSPLTATIPAAKDWQIPNDGNKNFRTDKSDLRRYPMEALCEHSFKLTWTPVLARNEV